MRRLTGWSPFAALPSAWQQSINHHWLGREREFISIPPMPSIFKNALIPLLWVDWPTLFIYFIVPTYLPTLELVKMNRDSLPYPPQMRNGGSPPAHLLPYPPQMRNGGSPPAHLPPYPPQMRNSGSPPAHLPSSPHSDPAIPPAVNVAAIVATIVSNLKSSLAAITASAEKALAEEKHCQEAAAQEKALADKANE
jgi:hypothetical protein